MPELPQRAEARGPSHGLTFGCAAIGAAAQAILVVCLLALEGRVGQLLSATPAALLGLCSVLAVTAEVASQRSPDIERDVASGRARFDRVLATITGLGLLMAWAASLRATAGTALGPWEVAGACVMIGGAALRCAAIRALGRRFVTEARVIPGATLEVSGIYRWLRHPSETGVLALAGGSALFARSSWLPWILLASVLLPATLVRVRREDHELARAFPERHRRYAAAVGGLLPRW